MAAQDDVVAPQINLGERAPHELPLPRRHLSAPIDGKSEPDLPSIGDGKRRFCFGNSCGAGSPRLI